MRNRLAGLVLTLGLLAPARSSQARKPAPTLAPDTSWVARSALYEVFVRDFSPPGNFRGLIDGLDRIQASGATVLWLMPIHPIGERIRKGTLGSPYAVRDYRAFNPDYGTAADFRALVEAVHQRGMKLILDWVPNHTAPDHPWVTEHRDWYYRDQRGEPMVPRDDKGKLTDWVDVAQLDYRNPAMRREMIATMTYWLQEYGIDGFRMDVAGFIPYDFWRQATPALRASVQRPILLLAEWGDLEMHRIGFDLTYGWDAYKRLKDVWAGKPASSFVRGELPDMRAMPAAGGRMRFTTNHDETAWDKTPLQLFGGPAGARAAFAAIALMPGRPLLYNGQEVESPKQLALFERDTVDWARPGAEDARRFYAGILKLARTEPGILSGKLEAVATDAPADIISYRRGDVVVLVNARQRATTAVVKGVRLAGSRELLSGKIQSGDSVALGPHGIAILKTGRTP